MFSTDLFPATRWSLVQRLDQTVSHAGVLIERYVPAVRAYLRMKFPIENRDGVDDLLQEVLLALMERPEVLAKAARDPGRPFRYYLMRVVYNHARNARRRLQAREIAIDDPILDVPAQDTEDEAIDTAWAIGICEMALEDCRGWEASGIIEAPAADLLSTNLNEGCGVRELATRFGLSRATCARRLAHAKQCLVTAIRDHLIAAGELDEQASKRDAHHILLRALARESHHAG